MKKFFENQAIAFSEQTIDNKIAIIFIILFLGLGLSMIVYGIIMGLIHALLLTLAIISATLLISIIAYSFNKWGKTLSERE